jgi:hypothetical protein
MKNLEKEALRLGVRLFLHSSFCVLRSQFVQKTAASCVHEAAVFPAGAEWGAGCTRGQGWRVWS